MAPEPGDLLRRPADLAQTFDRIPQDYEARPAYPAAVWEELEAACGLGPGTRVLEVGPGSGQATLPLLDRGARVTAVEPGPALAARLRERTAGRPVEVVVARFEDAALPAASFDLVASATAFHWVDPTIGAARCAAALRDGGWLALWWTIWGDPERPDPFHDALEPVLAEQAPELLARELDPYVYARDLAARAAVFDATGAFSPLRSRTIAWEGVHDPVGLRRLFATFAPWLALPEPRRGALLDSVEALARDRFGGTVRRPYLTVLYRAERLAR